MKPFALFAAALLALPFAAAAQPAKGYSATPATAPAVDSLITRSTPWTCGDTVCTTGKTAGSPLAMCQLTARQLGPLTAFVANGTAFAADQLEKCNARAK
ncbi:hypothetical protein ASG37_09105 [Sphingomonas sp. Leaf407]|uniref:CC_3452 family protein n=1 Tax=unclassified Sphingomonas TaxID=196159 RepID=UPI0006FDB1A8|nr:MULTISPECIES: hypothetical protein [unclassified Sphingomonas]KQN39680.1 hypothetical protein ASE97_06395 [Sphingomonas sp. Leaf42]KQT28955.1 hypothetical protein ASG37_09105 [Sphingomonas sp. Leaf407]